MGGLETLQPGVDPDRPVHVVFVGAGAVGCFYASRLHHPSQNIHVSLVARSNYKALAEHGVRLETHTFGDYTFSPHAVFPSVAAAAARPHAWDYIIVTTKALPDRSDDSELIAPLVGPDSCIVLIQNGVGVEQPYRARFPAAPIVSAVTVVSAEQTSPGTIRQNRWTRIHLGPYSNSASFSAGTPNPSPVSSSPRGDDTTGALTPAGLSPAPPSGDSSREKLTKTLQTQGAHHAALLADWWARLGALRDVDPTPDELALQAVRWHKLCINAAFNPSAVLAGGRGNADMVSGGGAELRAHLAGVMAEVWAAAERVLNDGGQHGGGSESRGRPFPPPGAAGPERILRSTERNVGGKPSMLVDWEAGRPLEVEVILGNPVRIARERGVEMPRVQSMYALLKSMQDVRDGRVGRGKL